MRTRIFLSPPHMGGTELDFIRQAFESNFVAPAGPQLQAFEEAFARTVGLPHCLALSSGTAAMHLALRHLGVGSGDVVIASTLTFIGSVSPAHYLGAELLFVDADRASWNMDPARLEEAVKLCLRQGKKPAAVVPTDLYGQCADYDAIEAICQDHGVPLVTDAAESLGATYKNRPAGNAGRAAVFSFNGNKIITTSGGGMLASEDEELIAHCRKLSQQAREPAPHYEHEEIGYNYRMSNIVAAIGLGQLEVLEDRVRRRREIFEAYREGLADLPGVGFMPEAPYGAHNRWLTVVTLDPEAFGAAPEDVRQALEAEDIESRPVWKPMHMQPVFQRLGHGCVGGEVAEELFSRGLCLPSGANMSESDLGRVISIVRNRAKA
ncbi:MAG: DegT/DnrJ/EryC1/StrS family aminotransferase [Desulfovibrionaceae bacterium]